MNNTIIELRQQNANSNVARDNVLNPINGDYRCNFEPVTINPNDAVAIKSAFIDSLNSSSDKVFVPEVGGVPGQCEISLTNGYYTNDWGTTFDSIKPNKTFNVVAGNSHPDCKPYILSVDKHSGNPADTNLLTEFRIPVGVISPSDMKINLGQFESLINFVHPDGSQLQVYVSLYFDRMPKDEYLKMDEAGSKTAYILVSEALQKKYPQAWKGSTHLLPFAIKQNTIGDMNFDKTGNFFVREPYQTFSQVVETLDNNSVFTPYLKETTFSIDSGSYDPQELAVLLSQKMSATDLSGDNNIPQNPVNNNFLKTSKQLASATELNTGTNIQLTKDDATDIMTISTNAEDLNYYVGASQVAVGYDEELRKFTIEQIHSSLYDSEYTANTQESGTGQKQIRLLHAPNNSKAIVNKNTGIFFTRLEPNNLWFDVMGFNQNTIITSISPQVKKASIGGDTNVVLSPVTLIDGVNITGDSSGIDSVIIKSNSNPPDDGSAINADFIAFDVAPNTGDTRDILTNVGNTVSIFSSKLSQESKQKEPYFQIELDQFNQEMIGKDSKSNKIQAILSRYYSDDAFTFSYNEGSTPYIHRSSQPMYLSSLRIRILNPDGTVDSSLGPRNTIFLEIQRALQE